MKIAIGADHAGYELKEKVKRWLVQHGIDVDDRGTHSAESVDYPDYARAVAEEVSHKEADFGVLVCGSGIGMAITANKVAGVRAANVSSEHEAELSRAHNDANVLTLGARLMDERNAFQILDAWLSTPFAGGRHQRRVDKISEIERAEAQKSLATNGKPA
jgi:ribose 5-phosphate isomerase B